MQRTTIAGSFFAKFPRLPNPEARSHQSQHRFPPGSLFMLIMVLPAPDSVSPPPLQARTRALVPSRRDR